MRKPTRCQLCQVVQCSKCHCGFLFCSPGLERGSGPRPPLPRGPSRPLLISFPAEPKPLGFPPSTPSSASQCRWCMLARGLGPKGTCPSFGVTTERSHPLRQPPSTGTLGSLLALPSWLPPFSKINILAFSSSQAAALSNSAYFQPVSSSSGTHSQGGSSLILHPPTAAGMLVVPWGVPNRTNTCTRHCPVPIPNPIADPASKRDPKIGAGEAACGSPSSVICRAALLGRQTRGEPRASLIRGERGKWL